jgi:hypothetical protein
MQQADSAVMKANEVGDIASKPMPSADKGLLTDKCEIPEPEKENLSVERGCSLTLGSGIASGLVGGGNVGMLFP